MVKFICFSRVVGNVRAVTGAFGLTPVNPAQLTASTALSQMPSMTHIQQHLIVVASLQASRASQYFLYLLVLPVIRSFTQRNER